METPKTKETGTPKDETLAERVRIAIEIYDLIPATGKVVFALSDGGDSRALLHILTVLGYQDRLVPVIVDMGYTTFNATPAKVAVEALGYQPFVVNVHDETFQSLLDPKIRDKLKEQLTQITQLDPSIDLATSPCRPCYASKRIALDFIAEHPETVIAAHNSKETNEPSVIIFGHHMDDSIDSLLKEFLFRIHAATGETYSRPAFRSFVQGLKKSGKPQDAFAELSKLAEAGQYSTTEPISETKDGIRIVRPFVAARVFKHYISAYIFNHQITGIKSGCPHSDDKSQHTAREIVRDELTQLVYPSTRNYFADLVMKGLNEKGEARAPRRRDDLVRYTGGKDI